MQLYFWDAFSEDLWSQCNIKLKAKLENIFLISWPLTYRLDLQIDLDIFPPLGSPQSCYFIISLLKGHPGVQQHYGATWTILPIKGCYIGHGKPFNFSFYSSYLLLLLLLLCASLVIFSFSLVPIACPLDILLRHPFTEATEAHFFVQESSLTQRIQVPTQISTSFQQELSWTHRFEMCYSWLLT